MHHSMDSCHDRHGGAYLQGGFMLTARTEITGRYSRLDPREGSDLALVDADEVGAGVNHYLQGHDLKVQADYFRVTEPALRRRVNQARIQLQPFF